MCGVESHITAVVAINSSGSMDHHRNTPQGDGDTTDTILTLFDPMTHTPLGSVFHIYLLMCILLTFVATSGSHDIKGFQDFAES